MRILYCNCSYSPLIPDAVKRELLSRLAGAEAEVTAVPDLCALAAERDPLLQEAARSESLVIVACYPRAVRWLFHWAGAPLKETGVTILNMRTESPSDILTEASGGHPPGPVPAPALDPPVGLIPWFPVIDYDRCVNCRECLEFCLFGVYGEDDCGTVTVVNPEKCKTNCPACGRLCPEVAVMFPKVEESPLNGAEIIDEELEQANVRVNIDQLLGDNVYAALAKRRYLRQRCLLKKAMLRNGPHPPQQPQ